MGQPSGSKAGGAGQRPATTLHLVLKLEEPRTERGFTTKDVGKGTGLGLSTCYGIVKQAGGQDRHREYARHRNHDACVSVRTDAAVESAAARPTAQQAQTRHETVLIVDDDDAVRHLVTRVLALRGYRIFEASDATNALDVLQRHGRGVHLLLTDVGLPGTNGFMLAEAAVGQWPQVKVLHMSGYDRTAAAGATNATRIAEVSIQKPVTPADLLVKVRAVLDSPEAPA